MRNHLTPDNVQRVIRRDHSRGLLRPGDLGYVFGVTINCSPDLIPLAQAICADHRWTVEDLSLCLRFRVRRGKASGYWKVRYLWSNQPDRRAA